MGVRKFGLMLGLDQRIEEVHQVMPGLRGHDQEMLIRGRYPAPSDRDLPV